MDTIASALVLEKWLAHTLGIWTRLRKVKIMKEDGSFLEAKLIVNTVFQAIDSYLVSCKFAIDAKLLDIGNMDIIYILS